MLEDAINYKERTGRPPQSVYDLGGNYELAGFRADINYNGPYLHRMKNGQRVYSLHFIAPYSYHYRAYPDSRKLCDADRNFRADFVEICGYLAGQDFSNVSLNNHGYYRTAIP